MYTNGIEKNLILNICQDATGMSFLVIYYSTFDGIYKRGFELEENSEEMDFAFEFANGLNENNITSNMLIKNFLTKSITSTSTYPSVFLGTKPTNEEEFKLALANTIKLIKSLNYPYFLAHEGEVSAKRNRREDPDYIKEADELYFAMEGKII